MSVKLTFIAFSACISLLNANPIVDNIIQYDVIFTAKYMKMKSGSTYVVQEEIRGKITKSIMNRVKITARLEMDDNQMVLFMFWKNGSNAFEMQTIDKKNRIRSWIKGKFHLLTIKDLIDAVNREGGANEADPENRPDTKLDRVSPRQSRLTSIDESSD